ncbi:MAG: hypothetical protein KF782_24130 [Labilithrix sp.]|nr:hypothetical protein [Labilithrix sp.]
MRTSLACLLSAASLAFVLACSTEDATTPPAAADDGEVEDGEDAAAGDDDGGTSPGDAAPARGTRVEATINEVSRALDRAQYGLTEEGETETLYLEAHEGGVEECPEKETPKRTLIVSGVPKGEPGARFTKSDGVSVTLFDFAGDQIDAPKPFTTATDVNVTIVAIDGETSVEIEVDATFAEGTAKGRVYATYCAAMSQ